MLKRKLRSKDSNVRQAAEKALGEIGNERDVDPLTIALNDSDEGVRRTTAEALDKYTG